MCAIINLNLVRVFCETNKKSLAYIYIYIYNGYNVFPYVISIERREEYEDT